jgi:CRP-like cAMP-binding protein
MKSEDTQADSESRIRILKSLSTFGNENETLLEQAASRTAIKYFPKDAKIVTQGQSNKCLYWILSGSVRVDRLVPFVCRTKTNLR